MTITKPFRIRLGSVTITPGAALELSNAGLHWKHFLDRHSRGDFGDLVWRDIESNNRAIDTGRRILSAYTLPTKARLWIITDAGSTFILLPSDF